MVLIRFSSVKLDKNDFSKNLYSIYIETQKLKRIRLITNELLHCGAYSSINQERQLNKLDKINCPQWEKNIIGKAVKFKREKAHELFKELERLLDGRNEKNIHKDKKLQYKPKPETCNL